MENSAQQSSPITSGKRTLSPSQSMYRHLSHLNRISEKNIRDGFFVKRPSIYNFLYILCLSCIYYKTDLIVILLYTVVFLAVASISRTVP
jgi:hypothetical protein